MRSVNFLFYYVKGVLVVMENIPPVPANSFRVTLTQTISGERLDGALMKALREQNDRPELKTLSRGKFKELFAAKKIHIKGQPAKPASTLSSGVTYIDILGLPQN